MADRAVRVAYVSNDFVTGGNGGAGGAGGDLTVSFVNGTFKPDPGTGLATFGLLTISLGGQGGDGGPNDPGGVRFKVGGNGAAGGSGGSVMLAADGAIRALSTGVEVRSAGGAGGIGGNSLDYIDYSHGPGWHRR